MNFFQEQLKRFISQCDNASKVKYIGRTAFISIGDDMKIKLEFITLGVADNYVAIRMTAINNTEEVDITLIRFDDYCTPKDINYRITPYIWRNGSEYEWYKSPSINEISTMAGSIDDYISVFSPTENQNYNNGINF